MTAVRIVLRGCDDSAEFNMDVDDGELVFLKRLCDRTQEASSYSCQPDMRIAHPPEHRTEVGYVTYDEDAA